MRFPVSIASKSRRLTTVALLAALFSTSGTRVVAQEASHEGHTHIGWLSADILERPVSQQQGIGKIHEAVSTKSARAQIFYDQGLAYLQSYVWVEAARSFHQALRSDPQLAMAYVGLSYAYSPMDFAAAADALAKAQALSEHMSARERQRVHIRGLQLQAMASSGNAEGGGAFAAFKQSLDDALAEFPGDEQFLLLRGNAEEANPFGDGQGCVASAIPFYEKALATSPGNFAANHFLIHCYENSGRPQEALKFARLYVSAAPEIPHAHHMYGHVLRRTGGMLEAIAQFKAADTLELEYFKKNNFPPTVDWHHPHNLGLLASSYQFLGKMKLAESLYRRAGSLTPHSDFDAFNRKDLCEFLLDRARYAEALAAARALADSSFPLARSAGHSLAGSALLGLNKPEEAAHELELAENEAAPLPPAEGPAARLPIAMLRANLLMVQRSPEASPLLQRIAKRIVAENGPDAWIQGLYELERIHRAARMLGDWEVATQFAQLMVERAPEYAGAHYAMALCAQHDGDKQRAETEFALAGKRWANADTDLFEMRDLRQKSRSSLPQKPAASAKGSAEP
jgi:tetratricopeptide (TPR) repeat protein